MTLWPFLQSQYAGGESGSAWCEDLAHCRVVWGESVCLVPKRVSIHAARSPLPLWQRLSHRLRHWPPVKYWPPIKILIKLQVKYKCSHPGQPEWFCSPSILIFVWDWSDSWHATVFLSCLSPLQCNYLIQRSPKSLFIMRRISFKWWKQNKFWKFYHLLIAVHANSFWQSRLNSSTQVSFSPSVAAVIKEKVT